MSKIMTSLFEKLDAVRGSGGTPGKIALIDEALGAIEAEHGRESLEYAAALNEMGSCYRADADGERAAAYFQQATDLLDRVAPASSEYAMALMNLAGALRLNGQLEESLEGFRRAEELFAANLGTESMEYLTALNNEALCHQDRGDYAEALVNHLNVCTALEKLDDDSIAYATSLYNTGFCFKQDGEEELGDELIRKSIEVYRRLLPDDHVLMQRAKATLDGNETPKP